MSQPEHALLSKFEEAPVLVDAVVPPPSFQQQQRDDALADLEMELEDEAHDARVGSRKSVNLKANFTGGCRSWEVGGNANVRKSFWVCNPSMTCARADDSYYNPLNASNNCCRFRFYWDQ